MNKNQKPKILALIPARGGSKGLPQKNIRLLAGRPLIAWTIKAAQQSRALDRIIVSTDDQNIARVSAQAGVRVPELRPKKLAQDKTAIVDVVLYVLKQLQRKHDYRPDYVALLQPTSPLRTSKDIDQAVDLLITKKAPAIVSVIETSETPYWMRVINKRGVLSYFMRHKFKDYRRQDLPVVYIVNGAIYICRTDILVKRRTFSPPGTLGYVMPKQRSVDIDELIDFQLAETILTNKKRQPK